MGISYEELDAMLIEYLHIRHCSCLGISATKSTGIGHFERRFRAALLDEAPSNLWFVVELAHD